MNKFQYFVVRLLNLNPTPVEPEICQSCEALKGEVEHLRYQNKRFMDNLLVKPEPIIEKGPVPVTRPRTVPWAIKRQQLEREDREKAEAARAEILATRGAGKPDTKNPMMDTADLEREMDLVAEERENASK